MKTLKLILLLSVVMSMDSAAQTTYTIKQENYETMLEKVFKCARGWTEDGPVEYENLGYNDLGGFDDDDCYWSSSEYTDASYAIQKYFGSGAFGTGRERSEYFRVRPARAF